MEKTIKLLNKDTDDISNILELVLSQQGFESRRIGQYTLAAEEALQVWRDFFPDDEPVTASRTESSRYTLLSIEISGAQCNPLKAEGESDFDKLKERILVGCGEELKYFYKSGVNILRFKFPKKNTEETIFRWNYYSIAVPMAIQLLLSVAVTPLTALMIGFISQNSLAAVSLVTEFSLLFNAVAASVYGGAGILIAQYHGICNHKAIQELLGIALQIVLAAALIFFVAGYFFPEQIMHFYSDDLELIRLGAQYLKGISVTFIMNGLCLVYSSVMVNTGRVKSSTMYSVVSTIISVVITAVLLFGLFGLPALGLNGAVIAAIVSAVFWTVCIIREMVRSKELLPSIRMLFRFKSPYRKELQKNVVELFIMNISFRLSSNVIASLIGHMGPDIVAARALGITVTNLTANMSRGFGQGAGVLIGSDLGRGFIKQAEKKSPWIMKQSFVIASSLALLSYVLCRLMKMLPVDLSTQAEYYYNYIIVILAVNVFFNTLNNTFNCGFMQPGGQITYIFKVDFICYWGILIGGGYLLIYLLKAPVLLAIALLLCPELVTCLPKYYGFKSGKWKRRITKKENEI